MMKEVYINMIIELLNKTEDEGLLEVIYGILAKSC